MDRRAILHSVADKVSPMIDSLQDVLNETHKGLKNDRMYLQEAMRKLAEVETVLEFLADSPAFSLDLKKPLV